MKSYAPKFSFQILIKNMEGENVTFLQSGMDKLTLIVNTSTCSIICTENTHHKPDVLIHQFYFTRDVIFDSAMSHTWRHFTRDLISVCQSYQFDDSLYIDVYLTCHVRVLIVQRNSIGKGYYVIYYIVLHCYHNTYISDKLSLSNGDKQQRKLQ